MKLLPSTFLSLVLWLGSSAAANCPALQASYPAPVVSDGWNATLIAQDLDSPRGILFDNAGGLLVVQRRSGIVHLALEDGDNGCVRVSKQTNLIDQDSLNHGITLSEDGKTLYASSSDEVYSWSYDASGPSVTDRTTVVSGMDSGGHTSRTLLMSKKEPGILVISRGSSSNFDSQAQRISSGISQIKAFDLTNLRGSVYDYSSQGILLGWGLRNSVGVAEEPLTGAIYSVENSADEIRRDGVDIHEDNPGEEMNFHGYLNGSTTDQGGNYGYPDCLALWDTNVPNAGSLSVGSQFSGNQNSSIDDEFCATQRVPPRLTFQAHMAPLDIIFLPNGTEAYVSFHGSWDRTDPAGYKISAIAFNNGSPVAAPDSTTSTKDIMTNQDNSQCPDSCFRPVGLALDSNGRIFMSSDSTGEIYILAKGSLSTATPTDTSSPSPSPTKGAAQLSYATCTSLWILSILGVVMLL
ncbi:soluble quino protein glucose/sorbosone dehydrogenase [Bisporella sp. PMI_857]|nr:soluble quino protein glucose/sorbosone dehydrogenase [Bisporella sp. PMI_857]